MGAGGVINRCLYLSARYRLFYPAVAGSSAIIKRGHWLVPAVAPLHNYVQKKRIVLARIATDPVPVGLMWVSGHQALSALVVVGPVFRMEFWRFHQYGRFRITICYTLQFLQRCFVRFYRLHWCRYYNNDSWVHIDKVIKLLSRTVCRLPIPRYRLPGCLPSRCSLLHAWHLPPCGYRSFPPAYP